MGLGYSHQMWHRTTPVVSQRFRTIQFDNRGVGDSDVPPSPYPIAVMAADAAAVLDAAGVRGADIYGVSMGGMIAQEFVKREVGTFEVGGFVNRNPSQIYRWVVRDLIS